MAVELSPKMQAFTQEVFPAIIGTNRKDGSVEIVPVWFELKEGFIWVNSNTSRSWPKNLQRDHDVTMLIVDPREPDRYAQIRGRLVSLIPDPKHEFIDRLSHRYTGKQFRELEPGEHRVTLKIQPLTVTGQML